MFNYIYNTAELSSIVAIRWRLGLMRRQHQCAEAADSNYQYSGRQTDYTAVDRNYCTSSKEWAVVVRRMRKQTHVQHPRCIQLPSDGMR